MKYTKFVIFFVCCLFTATFLHAQIKLNFGKNSPLQKLQIAELAITNLYVDTVDESKLVEDAIRGMLEKLDPHSQYSDAEEVKAMNEPLQGNFDGIGIQFNMVDDTLMVIQTIVDGPSEKVGILAGDRIISANDTIIAGVKMARDKIVKKLRGPRGTKVRLGVVRRGVDEIIYFTVTRGKIPINTVDASYMIRPGIGYIRIGSFGANTYDEFKDAVKKLQERKMKKLILDLQDNGGGYMQTAVKIANEFLNKGELIVYTKGRNSERQEYKANSKGALINTETVILTNEFSASASEIVSGAIQDNDRGLIVGRRTFGKGLVQRPISLPDESMIRLTIAHYYTPSGRCIQKPYKKGDKQDYDMDIDKRYKNGEFTNADSIHFNDSLKCYTLRKHRVVYGGGGIMPDVFVPLDTTRYTKYYRSISAKGIIAQQVLKYIDKERNSLKSGYTTFEKFQKSFSVPESLIEDIYSESEKQKISYKDEEEKMFTTKELKLSLKALIARDLWSTTEYFAIHNEGSDIVKAALSQLLK